MCNQDELDSLDYRRVKDHNQILTLKVIEQLNNNPLAVNLNKTNSLLVKPSRLQIIDSFHL